MHKYTSTIAFTFVHAHIQLGRNLRNTISVGPVQLTAQHDTQKVNLTPELHLLLASASRTLLADLHGFMQMV